MNEIASRVETVATLATLVGVSPVRRVYKQCWVGIGLTVPGGPLTGFFILTFHKFIEVECESHPFASGDHRSADTLYYDIQDGGVMYLEVDWD